MKRTFTGICAALVAAGALTLVAAGPAAAGGQFCAGGNTSNAPDGRIRANGGEWDGGGSYVAEGPFDVGLGLGQSATYHMQWRNRAGDNLTIRLKLGYQERAGYAVKFFLAGENVTQHLQDGKALRFPHIAPGKRTGLLEVRVTNKSGTDLQMESFVRGSFHGNPNPAVCDEVYAQANDF